MSAFALEDVVVTTRIPAMRVEWTHSGLCTRGSTELRRAATRMAPGRAVTTSTTGGERLRTNDSTRHRMSRAASQYASKADNFVDRGNNMTQNVTIRTHRETALDQSWKFASIISTAISMSAALAHLMELPGKMKYERELYVRLHRTLYPTFGRTAGYAEALSVLSTGALAWWTRKRHQLAAPLTSAEAGCLAAAHGIFWVLVAPVNSTMVCWDLDAIPPDWQKWRNRWEYSYATRAVLVTGRLAHWFSLPSELRTRLVRAQSIPSLSVSEHEGVMMAILEITGKKIVPTSGTERSRRQCQVLSLALPRFRLRLTAVLIRPDGYVAW